MMPDRVSDLKTSIYCQGCNSLLLGEDTRDDQCKQSGTFMYVSRVMKTATAP